METTLRERRISQSKIQDVQVCGQRLDTALAKATGLSRSRIHKLLHLGQVQPLSSKRKPSKGDVPQQLQTYRVPLDMPRGADMLVLSSMPLDIVFQDDAVVVINKPAGLVVHPAPGHADDTLVNGLLAADIPLAPLGGKTRPGIVHRLDQGTSGLLVAAKTDQAYQHLLDQFQKRTTTRVYHVLLKGMPTKTFGAIEAPLARHPRHRQKQAVVQNGKFAKTSYQVIQSLGGGLASYGLCRLQTGRTHQVRVHMMHMGHPLLGDSVYGRKSTRPVQQVLDSLWPHPDPALHAGTLSFQHPISGNQLSFTQPLPENWAHLDLQPGSWTP